MKIVGGFMGVQGNERRKIQTFARKVFFLMRGEREKEITIVVFDYKKVPVKKSYKIRERETKLQKKRGRDENKGNVQGM